MHRRSFLKLLAASLTGLTATSRLYALPKIEERFLLVFLRGGYDATNILIPYSSQFYYEARPNIAIAKPDSTNTKAALTLTTDWALHPALRSNILPLYQQGQVAFIPFAGTNDNTRSHFETQDTIELGQPLTERRDYSSGFLNRLVAVLSGVQAVAFTETLPLSCKGSANIANLSLKGNPNLILAERESNILAEMYQGMNYDKYIKESYAIRQEFSNDLKSEMVQASRGAILSKGFELEIERVAIMMKENYNIGFIDVGGWDTHQNQGGAEGDLANKMTNLSNGLATFAQEMGSLWNKTVVLVISEFGRTFKENGNQGTDHGHGSVYWVLGGGLKGGRVVGEQIQITANHLFENRDYPVLNEYRGIIGGLFQKQFGLSENLLQKIFPSGKVINLDLL